MNRVPRHIYSQIVGTTGDTCPSIWIFYQDSRYIINCGEGFQRFSVQYGLRLSKLRGIFLTDLTWESIGGLPGSILTLSDIPSLSFEQPLQLFGPRNTSNWFKSCKPFLNRPKFNLSIEEFDHSHSNTECFKDENVTVRPIIIQSPRIKNTSERAHKKCLDVCCYAFHTPSFRGKFDPKKAQLHKVPKGPAYSQLTRGESVTSSDGILIHPHDVISPDIPGSVVLIIKCPSEEYLPSLTESSTWKDYQNGEFSQNISVMYHITPAKIMNHPKYESWIKTFATNTQHIAINENCSARTTFDSAAHNHFCMNTIDKEMFPELYEDTYTPSTPEHFLQGDIKTKFHIYPVQDPPMEVYPWHLDEEPLVRKIPIQFNAPESPCNIEQKNPVHALQKWDDTDITFLGTGSSCPGKYRNVSAIHLTTENGKHGILMDAGEGTLGQMFRVYGRKLQEIIKALKFIFITHIHADHHLGLNRIVQYRNTLLQGENESTAAPLYIVAPESVISWLGPYYDMIDNSCHLLRLNDIAKINTILDDYNLQFQPVPVVHCNDAYGFVFRHRSGWKLVYSGDTRPCNRLIEEGRDADLLIHEATFEDGMEEDAKAKRHCTVGEAIWVGQRMNAKSIVLTHFSQRYPKVPVLAPEISSKIGIAFDFMRLKFSWVSRFGRVFPIISKLFSDLEAEKEKEKELEADMLAKAKLSKRKSVPPRNDHDIPVTKKSRVASK